jgi:hypothetical protein
MFPSMVKASGKSAASERAPTLVIAKDGSRRRHTKASAPMSRSTPGFSCLRRRHSNAWNRKREYLKPDEVEKVLQAARRLGGQINRGL